MKKPTAVPIDIKFQPGQAVTVWHGDNAIRRCTVAVSNAKGIELTDGSRWNIDGWRPRQRGALSAPVGRLLATDIEQETAHTIAKRISWGELPFSVLEAVRAVLEGAQVWPIKDRAIQLGRTLGGTPGDGWVQKLVTLLQPHLPHAGYLVFTRAMDAYGEITVRGIAPTKELAVEQALAETNPTEGLVGFYGCRRGTVYTLWRGGAPSSPLIEVNITLPPGVEK